MKTNNHSLRLLTQTSLAAWLLAAAPSAIPAADEPAWTPISERVTSQVKPGYPGKTAGVTVDAANGDVFMVVPDQGLWKSTDQGDNFTRVDDGKIGGRCETGFALDAAPAGKGLMCFMIYGPSAWTGDGGQSWNPSKTSHLDFGAVDWSASGRAMLALRHESGGVLCYSTDAAATWKDLDKGFTALGLFSEKALIASRGQGLLRSDDGGGTWNPVSDAAPVSRVMRVHKGVGYWLTSTGLLASRDEGKTWAPEGAPVSAVFGPYWGNEADRLVVVGKQGFHETRDGGKTWSVAAPLPPGFDVNLVGPNYAWDPAHDTFYASSMGKDTLRFRRK